jgi:hypothetical protein
MLRSRLLHRIPDYLRLSMQGNASGWKFLSNDEFGGNGKTVTHRDQNKIMRWNPGTCRLIIPIFWDVTPLRRKNGYRRFETLVMSSSLSFLRRVRTENILKIYNTLILPTFLYGSENLTLTAFRDEELKREK